MENSLHRTRICGGSQRIRDLGQQEPSSLKSNPVVQQEEQIVHDEPEMKNLVSRLCGLKLILAGTSTCVQN